MSRLTEINLKDYILKKINGIKTTAVHQAIFKKIQNKVGESCHICIFGYIVE
jgi:hypothetical protein